MTGRIPLVDLALQHAQVAGDVATGFAEVLSATDFVGGKAVGAFEQEYAEFIDVAHCIGVANGTDALEVALRALDVGPGAEVVLPVNTFVATAEAVSRCGATPVFVDVDPAYLLIDPAAVANALTPRTGAVIPVHLYGQAAPMADLCAAAPGIPLVEDAAQAQGARQGGRSAGALGSVAATSFYPGKNLGAYGDAGAVLTDSAETARSVRLLANHGSERRYEHSVLGFNSRLDTLQAVVLRAKLARLREWNTARRAAAAVYDEMLAAVDGVTRPRAAAGNDHVWHLYVVRIPRRDAVVAALQGAGIGVAIHYPVPLHLQPAFRHLGYDEGAFPVAEVAAREILSLPLYPGIRPDQQQRVVDELRRALR